MLSPTFGAQFQTIYKKVGACIENWNSKIGLPFLKPYNSERPLFLPRSKRTVFIFSKDDNLSCFLVRNQAKLQYGNCQASFWTSKVISSCFIVNTTEHGWKGWLKEILAQVTSGASFHVSTLTSFTVGSKRKNRGQLENNLAWQFSILFGIRHDLFVCCVGPW